MIYRRLDANGDYTFGGSQSDFLTGAEAVAQAIKTTMKLFMGEWWENLNLGVPMWQQILGAGGSNKSAIDLILRQAILAVPNVTGMSNLQTALVNRAYSFYAVVQTAFGPVAVTNIPMASASSVLGYTVLTDDSGVPLAVDGTETLIVV